MLQIMFLGAKSNIYFEKNSNDFLNIMSISFLDIQIKNTQTPRAIKCNRRVRASTIQCVEGRSEYPGGWGWGGGEQMVRPHPTIEHYPLPSH